MLKPLTLCTAAGASGELKALVHVYTPAQFPSRSASGEERSTGSLYQSASCFSSQQGSRIACGKATSSSTGMAADPGGARTRGDRGWRQGRTRRPIQGSVGRRVKEYVMFHRHEGRGTSSQWVKVIVLVAAMLF